MSTTFERPPDEAADAFALLAPGGLSASAAVAVETPIQVAVETDLETAPTPSTLGALPLGAHLVLRCRKDWRTATVVRIELEKITLSVSSPTGRTYRLSRPPDTPLTFDGDIPLLGDTAAHQWRAGLAHYDVRW
ncbi:MAG TPA: hypothetical protein VGW12_04765 [Pyrinomonadaceae bacterium]|nr:hypothetical protein [Pyrinomonadaceae bacterium]